MKKGLFNGKIKREYILYIWFTIIFIAAIGIGVGSLLLYNAFIYEAGSFDRNMLLLFSALAYLFGVLFFVFTIFVIRKYPKYPKLRRFLLNSDYYFVDNDSKEFHGYWRGKPAFDMVTNASAPNEDLADIKYRKRYKVYITLIVIGMVLLFGNIIGFYLLIENIASLPKSLQNEAVIFIAFIAAEIVDIILLFVFAFKVKNTREAIKYKTRR